MDGDQGEINIKIDGPITDASPSESVVCGASLLKGEVAENSHRVPRFYRQDVVRHKKTCSIGIVNDVAGDSDSDSSADDFDEEDDNEEGGDKFSGLVDDRMNDSDARFSENYSVNSLPADQVRILWLDNSEEVLNVDDLVLVDRGFLHGDYVASALEPTGQVGVVQDVDIVVDLLAPDGSILKEVSSKDLKRVREFSVGDYVVYGPWLGRVDDVFDNVTVQLDDGSSCKVLGADPLRLKSVSNKNLDEDSQFPYYPGQRVKASSSSVFKNSKWLSGFWKANKLEGTVTKVTVGSVIVYWIASAGYGPDSSIAPSEKQSPKNLKLLSCFAHASWELGDYCMIPSSGVNLSYTQGNIASKVENIGQEKANCYESSTDIDKLDENHVQSKASLESSSCYSSTSDLKDSSVEKWPLHRKKMRRVFVRKDKKSRRNDESFEKAYMIINTETRIDVAWQNGTTERSMDSKLLIPIDSPGDHEFVTEQYVIEKASDETDSTSESRRCGVIHSVNAKEKTARVRWLKTVERPDDHREFDVEEIVSVYELEGHPDYDYTYGDVVVRLSPITSFDSLITDDNSVVDAHNNCENGGETTSETQNLDNLVNPSSEFIYDDPLYVSWVGNITGLKNGDIEVTWADGMVSSVGPQAIFVVGRDDDLDDESMTGGSDVSDGGASWETVNDETDGMGKLNEEESVVGNNDERNVELDDENSVRNRLFPLAVVDFVGKLAGIFSRKKMIEQGTSDQHENSARNADLEEDFGDDSYNIISGTRSKENGVDGEVDGEVVLTSESTSTSDGENVKVTFVDCNTPFKRFDTAQNPLDHHFLVSINQVSNSRKWLKKVQQDWTILQNNLPDGIYVRVYEDRMDLIRAVMVGAYGTPYQDGLFFFDFYLPADYPDVPPSAHYHSGGWRINPNLYEEGKVCLSLLNTWTGRGNEVWDPKSSSILQVLVSLQGLVLNSRPYFNEAGYDKQVGTAEGEKNSLSYNENTFLLNCKTMMFLIRRPPKDFEDLIKEHFCVRGKFILMACDAYMKGSLIGSLNKDANVSVADGGNSTSVGFKLMLAKITPKLYTALANIGADCADFKHLVSAG